MDKGLKLINELKIKLEKLLIQQEVNKNEMNLEKSKQDEINFKIGNLESTLKELEEKKEFILSAPENYKKERKSLIKAMVSAAVAVAVIMLIVGLISSFYEGIQALIQTMTVVVIAPPITGATLFYMFNRDLKKRYETEDLSKIEEEINQVTYELEEEKEKRNEFDKKLEQLEKEDENLSTEILGLNNKKDKLENIRTQVINDYCNNPEFDNLFDKALNSTEESQNQKSKKGNN